MGAKELRYRVFDLIYRVGFGETDPGLIRFKTIMIVTVLEFGVVLATTVLIESLFEVRLVRDVPRPAVALFSLALMGLNFKYVFPVAECREFRTRFRAEGPGLRRRGTALAITVIVAALAATVLAILEMLARRGWR